ncbi:efflux RND transporter periplasmic adaptor subunit [Ahrensia sp. 13_GOM-1096m]|uniref:efflux RND transporter periplasmic adaptor subunit n=1 Tax=Ahrensia sp. 13_GOM-1096m TaxID=1380380 RepID=UPI0004797D51|nr:efflux RND transporter periplasmic adaptor subunit [Ahrensia sp. 13_GOM-1096m]
MKILSTFALLLAITTLPVSAQAQEPSGRPVKLISVSQPEQGRTREFYGQVVALQTVDLAFQTAGQLVEFSILEGQTISAGELVARLDPEPLELALEQARLRDVQAKRDLDRLKRLSRSTVSQATQDDATTAAGLAAVALKDAERALSKATLNAPFDALVAERLVANYTTVAAGTPVVRLHDMSELRVEVEVPEILFQRSGNDKDLEIHASFPGNSTTYPLKLREFATDATAVGQSFKITLSFDTENTPKVMPGSSVTVSAREKRKGTSLAVPTAALVSAPDGSVSVMVFEETEAGARVVARAVEIEVADDGKFLVTAGLSEGEEIVAAGASMLDDGQAVRRFTGFPN